MTTSKKDGSAHCCLSLDVFSRRNIVGESKVEHCRAHLGLSEGVNSGVGVKTGFRFSRSSEGPGLMDLKKFSCRDSTLTAPPAVPVCGRSNSCTTSDPSHIMDGGVSGMMTRLGLHGGRRTSAAICTNVFTS